MKVAGGSSILHNSYIRNSSLSFDSSLGRGGKNKHNENPPVSANASKSAVQKVTESNNTKELRSYFYQQFFPARSGVSAIALADAVTNPGKETSSLGKDFGLVAQDARKRIDVAYEKMAKSGQPFSNTYKDVVTSMGQLDRRSLYAVSSNEGNYFTKNEQSGATTLMSKQQELAMGFFLYPGADLVFDNFGGNEKARFGSLSKFLHGVSLEEKQSANWTVQASIASQRSVGQNEDQRARKPHLNLIDIVFGNKHLESDQDHNKSLPEQRYDFLSGGVI